MEETAFFKALPGTLCIAQRKEEQLASVVVILQHLPQFCRDTRTASIQKVGKGAGRRILDFTLRQWGVNVGRCFGCWNGSGAACACASSARFTTVLTETGENMNLRPNTRPGSP